MVAKQSVSEVVTGNERSAYGASKFTLFNKARKICEKCDNLFHYFGNGARDQNGPSRKKKSI